MESILAHPPLMSISDERAAAVAARLKRDVGVHRAAQTLADAMACRVGETPRGLSTMLRAEADWYRQTARNLIEIYETCTGITPENAVETRRREEDARKAEAAVQNRVAIERQLAAVAAAERGHELGPWHADGPELGKGIERASCARCRRVAVVDINLDPPRAGLALTTGCLTRPDAFLSQQPDAAREGGGQ